MEIEFWRFNNHDLGTRVNKYFGGVKMKMNKDLIITQLDEDEYALDVYAGDERPLIDYDTYMYDTEQEAMEDALLLFYVVMQDRIKKKYSWKLFSGGGIFTVDSEGNIIKTEPYYGNELEKLYPTVQRFDIDECIDWIKNNVSEEWMNAIQKERELDVNLLGYWNADYTYIEADEGFREEFKENSLKAFEINVLSDTVE